MSGNFNTADKFSASVQFSSVTKFMFCTVLFQFVTLWCKIKLYFFWRPLFSNIYKYNAIIAIICCNEHLIFTLTETTIPLAYVLKFSCKLVHIIFQDVEENVTGFFLNTVKNQLMDSSLKNGSYEWQTTKLHCYSESWSATVNSELFCCYKVCDEISNAYTQTFLSHCLTWSVVGLPATTVGKTFTELSHNQTILSSMKTTTIHWQNLKARNRTSLLGHNGEQQITMVGLDCAVFNVPSNTV